MISFIVRTKNEERWVGHCIQSIIDNFNKDEVEIKIIDNESIDQTLQVVKMFKQENNLSIMSIPKNEYTPGKSLNMGLNSISNNSDIACLISAHCVVNKLNLKMLRNHFKNNKCFGVLGRQIPVYSGKRLNSKYVWENFKEDDHRIIKNLKENIKGDPPFFHNAFSFINVAVWKKFKFDENLTGKEDRAWAKSLLEREYYSLYDSSQVCTHHWTSNCATWSGLG